MITMRVVKDPKETERFAAEYGVEPEAGLCLYLAENRGESIGVCFYRFTDFGMKILLAETDGDLTLFDGLIRATMAALFDREEDRVEFDGRMDREALRSCRFVTGDEMWIASANHFFETCKNCKN